MAHFLFDSLRATHFLRSLRHPFSTRPLHVTPFQAKNPDMLRLKLRSATNHGFTTCCIYAACS